MVRGDDQIVRKVERGNILNNSSNASLSDIFVLFVCFVVFPMAATCLSAMGTAATVANKAVHRSGRTSWLTHGTSPMLAR